MEEKMYDDKKEPTRGRTEMPEVYKTVASGYAVSGGSQARVPEPVLSVPDVLGRGPVAPPPNPPWMLGSDIVPDEFYAILGELSDLHYKKQQDYGSNTDPYANVRASELFNIPAWVGALVRAQDKIKRIQSFVAKGRLANESLEDSLMDNAVYAIIALVLYRETVRAEEVAKNGPKPEPPRMF